jgi:ABC-type bacteriocin/lantibiotic exporter with double-glycine peptidase domain
MTQNKEKPSPLRLIWELFNFERKEIAVVVSFEIFAGLLLLTIPIGVQTVVNTFAFTQQMQPVFILAMALIAGQVFAAIFKISQMIAVEKMQQRIMANFAMEMAFRLPRLERAEVSHPAGLVHHFYDTVVVQKGLSRILLEGVSLTLQTIIGLILLGFYHPFLLAFDVVLVISIIFCICILGRGLLAANVEESRQKYRIGYWLDEITAKPIIFGSKSARDFALEKTDEIVADYLRARDRSFRVIFRQVTGLLSLQAIANTSLLLIGIWLITKNQLSVGQLVAAEIVVSTVLYSLTRFQKHIESFADLGAALDKVATVFHKPLEPFSGDEHLPEDPAYKLECRNLFYRFKSQTKQIGPISFVLQPGQKMAIHGLAGSGKSTLINILYGIKRQTSGVILINNRDVRSIPPEMIRERVALVRGVEVINGSILQNIRLGNPDATIDKINDALNRVGILDDILLLTDGLDTVLDRMGAPLSISQVRGLMIARAILSKPAILLLDETLDGLDSNYQQKLLDVILGPEAAWTALITSSNPEVESKCGQLINLEILTSKYTG